MTSWQQIAQDCPQFAARVREVFDAGTNKTLATLRRDGAPRISATELSFEGGQVSLGMMPRSVKLADVRRDPRVAVHSPTLEPPKDPAGWLGDAKLAGVLVETEPPDEQHPGASFFRLDVTEVVLTYVTSSQPGGPVDQLVVESWHPGIGHRRRSRD
jgi:hypothetical protein